MKKRILMLLRVVALMVVMLVATAVPALSVPQEEPPPLQANGPNCQSGQAQAVSNAPNTDLQAKHQENQTDCVAGNTPGEGFDK